MQTTDIQQRPVNIPSSLKNTSGNLLKGRQVQLFRHKEVSHRADVTQTNLAQDMMEPKHMLLARNLIPLPKHRLKK